MDWTPPRLGTDSFLAGDLFWRTSGRQEPVNRVWYRHIHWHAEKYLYNTGKSRTTSGGSARLILFINFISVFWVYTKREMVLTWSMFLYYRKREPLIILSSIIFCKLLYPIFKIIKRVFLWEYCNTVLKKFIFWNRNL